MLSVVILDRTSVNSRLSVKAWLTHTYTETGGNRSFVHLTGIQRISNLTLLKSPCRSYLRIKELLCGQTSQSRAVQLNEERGCREKKSNLSTEPWTLDLTKLCKRSTCHVVMTFGNDKMLCSTNLGRTPGKIVHVNDWQGYKSNTCVCPPPPQPFLYALSLALLMLFYY